jgi:hypothetical protein
MTFSLRARLSFVLLLAATLLTSFDALASAVAQAPTPTFPAAYILSRSPQFEWSPAAHATSYEFMLMDDTDSAIYFDQAGISEPVFSIAGAVFDQSKVYHWKVRGFDIDGSAGPWSEIESFLIYDPAIVPNLLAPMGYITTTTPLFQWSKIAGAVSYELTILSEDEQNVINTIGGINDAFFQEPSNMPLAPYTVYHYKVRARMPDGTVSISSNPGSFMMYSGSDIPQLIGPTIQAPLGLTNFSWKPLEVAAGYEFMLMSEDEQSVLIDDTSVKVNGYMPSANVALQVGVVYHWKVRTIMASGLHSLWSDTFSFVYYDPTIVPDPLMPFGYITSTRPIIEFSQVNDAVSYTIEVRASITQAVLFTDTITNVTTYDLSRHLKLSRDFSYDWRVKAQMSDGQISVFSAPRAFQITSKPWEGLITNQKTSAVYYPSQEVKFSWQPLALVGLGYVRYHLQLRIQPNDGNYRTLWSGDANPSEPSYLVLPSDVILAPRTYYAWIVQAYNVDNLLIGESRKVVFKTPAPVPTAEFQARIDAYKAQLAQTFDKFVADLAERHEDLIERQKAALEELSEDRQELVNRHAAGVSLLGVSFQNQTAALVKSQASQLAALQKNKKTTPDQIAALQTQQQQVLQDLQAKQNTNLSETSAKYLAQEQAFDLRAAALNAQYTQQSDAQLVSHAAQIEKLKAQQVTQLANFIRRLSNEHLKMH